MRKLIIVRGLPGSGKSTLAKKIKDQKFYSTLICIEADMFFETPNGYEFDIARIKDAHNWCYYSTMKALKCGMDVIVSNTFTTNWEMERYIKLGEIFDDLFITIINVTTQFETIHGVPEETMKKMKDRWEDVNPAWDVNIYSYPEMGGIVLMKERRNMNYIEHFGANMRVSGKCIILAVFHAIHAIIPIKFTEHEYWNIM